MKLTEKPKTYIYFQNKKIKLKPYFWNVLRCDEILSDEILNDKDKIMLCFNALVKQKRKWKTTDEKLKLLEEIFCFLSNGDMANGETKKVFDFQQDADHIYAAFLQIYKIDLFSRKGRRLHWHQFMSLFSALPDTTRMMQIIEIRTKPIPKATKYNGEERQQLMRLKAIHKLKISEAEQEKQLASGLWKMAEMLESMTEERR